MKFTMNKIKSNFFVYTNTYTIDLFYARDELLKIG
jgi:hypothetical protein